MYQKNKLEIELIIIGFISVIITFLFKRSICIFINIFGIPCPSCGMTRAYLSLVHLNYKEAFKFHPLFWCVPILIFYRKRFVFYTIGILFIIVWLIRIYLYFPTTEPFKINEKALYIMILKKMRNI
jgi:hypothetical protein